MIYIFIFIALILLRYSLLGHPRLQWQFYPLVLLFLYIFTAFRFQVGCDWSTYYQIYQAFDVIIERGYIALREPLWFLLMGALHKLDASFVWVNVMSATIFFLGIDRLARKTPDPLGFLIMLFPILIINIPMSAIRQAAALGFLCYAFAAFLEKKQKKYIFFAIIATGFHTSALLFIPLVMFIHGKNSYKRIIAAILIELPLLGLMWLSSYVEAKSKAYVGTGYDAEAAIFRSGILAISALVFFLFYKNKWKEQFPYDYNFIHITSLAMLGNFFIVFFSTVISDRLGYYFITMQAILFARLPMFERSQFRIFFVAAPYLGLLLIFLVWTSLSPHFNSCYLPYQSWLFGLPGPIL
ncbi:EpsG family protein [Pseudomonadota bacterium]|nr:EpsG family protein [Pseudomonadota bacterium]